ncbi:helix-turn-helix domain-containing protein [Enterococcus sp. HY326]|uniref:helix-turn-helix domain-containing protein n=1 Tax=Enterococcus sp. HY326 TaxID=2971265 RepID=UPI0022406A7B|nr:helix-turn-helix domain-containing protein [Enterococcus sp. HY326]
MKTVLILTECIVVEREIKEKLEILGYEVFCSNLAINTILKYEDDSWIKFFEIVIFSESLANHLVEGLVHKLRNLKIQLYRIEAETTDDSQDSDLMLTGVFSPTISIAELREEISNDYYQHRFYSSQKNGQRSSSLYMSNLELNENPSGAFISMLSKKELEVFLQLYHAQGQHIKRNDLATKLWGLPISQSNLAQLSQIITRLKMKLMKLNFDERCLTTSWRKGYALSPEFYEKNSFFTEKQMESTD